MKLNGKQDALTRAVIEDLERRLCMDGAVRAAVVDGDLVVSGDDADNQVVVSPIDGQTICVRGLDGTKVNGKRSRWFTNTFDDLEIRMRQGGDDAVSVHGPMTIRGDIDAEMGDGELVVEGSASPLEVGEELVVRGGESCDVTLRNDVRIRGLTSIRTGGSTTVAAAEATVPDFSRARFTDPLTIDNPYFPLVPGAAWTYEEQSVDDETGETVTQRIDVEVTNETKTILGVATRVLRDRVFEDGLLIEDTVDWHAQDDNGNVWYFGEETTDFEYDDDGNLIDTNTEASWEAGVNGAAPGVIMEAKPTAGDRYYQEFEPGGALDFGGVLGTTQTVRALGKTFANVVRTEDVNLAEPASLEHKFYAPGLGMVKEHGFDRETGEVDGTLRLVSAMLNGQPVKQFVSPGGFDGQNQAGRATGAVQLFGETVIRSAGPVVLYGVHAHDEVELFAESGVIVVKTVLEDLSVDAAETVAIWESTAAEEVVISSDADAAIFGCTFRDDVEIKFGSGDNELTVKGSTFDDLVARGGGGDDSFEDLGRNIFDSLNLIGFDEG